MIELKVDEAYAFDYLSILQIKHEQFGSNEFLSCFEQIVKQVGIELVRKIVSSPEYGRVINANRKVFDIIEEMRQTNYTIDARMVDRMNTERYEAKKQLQKVFFGNEVTEFKT